MNPYRTRACLTVEEGGQRVLGLGAGCLELGKGILGNINVLGGIGQVVKDLDAGSGLVQDVGDASGQESKGGLGDTKLLANGVSLVGEDREVESELGGEGLLGFNVLSRDSNQLGSEGLANVLDFLVEALGLGGAALKDKREDIM